MVEKTYDVVIVGSGAGGGTVAKELAPLCRQGLRIAVLEWGPKLRENEFTGREAEMADKLYFDSGGVLTRDRAMTLAFARAYGGSTVVYTGTSLTLPEAVLGRWGVPGIEFADLRRRSEKYLGENNVHLLATSRGAAARACATSAARTPPSRGPTACSSPRPRPPGSRW
ncbi:MAG: hypothetical protein B7Z61_12560 [Acidobacteria bacterium 37-71-11]|nr:MAG: hypothetical protein B7Z61_12560 [Acidobacteria bacterium 37-71-11]